MIELRCERCDRKVADGDAMVYACPVCGGILDVGGYALRDLRWEDVDTGESDSGIWRFRELLPIRNQACQVTLHEGNTPLYRQRGDACAYLKDETRNPTGSFKDRPACVAVSKARELGVDSVVIASSGNAAVSTAAYAAVAGMRSVILVPEGTPEEKLCQMVTYGAHIVLVRGDYSDAFALATQVAERTGWMNVTTTYLNPYATEGDKTIAYELHSQLEGDVPQWVLIPVGAGPLLAGIYQGYRELQFLGEVEALPRMVAVQSDTCAPIARAFEEGARTVRAWDAPHGLASGILDPLRGYTKDGDRTLRIIRESKGWAIAVSDEEIMAAVDVLGSQGLFAEPAGAAAVAGLASLQRLGIARREETAVSLVTGSALKHMQPLLNQMPSLKAVDANAPGAVGAVLQAVED